MKVQESFVVPESPERLWEFLEQTDEVARCVPGIDSVEQLDADNANVRLTQSVGPMTATFEMKMRITERRPQESMTFTAIGRAVRGAAGNVRSTNTVRLAPVEDGTRVDVEADLALGGMLGSVGSKVVAKQAGKVTGQFAEALRQRLAGGPPPATAGDGAPSRASVAARPAAAPAGAAAPAAGPAAPEGAPTAPPAGTAPADWLTGRIAVPVPVAGGVVALIAALLGALLRRGRR